MASRISVARSAAPVTPSRPKPQYSEFRVATPGPSRKPTDAVWCQSLALTPLSAGAPGTVQPPVSVSNEVEVSVVAPSTIETSSTNTPSPSTDGSVA